MKSYDDIEILDEHIIYQQGCFCKVKRWLRGVHPHLGLIVHGLTGLETLQETSVIKITQTFLVVNESDKKTEVCPEPRVLQMPPLDDLQSQKQPQFEHQREAA